jgi:hypothetical protein
MVFSDEEVMNKKIDYSNNQIYQKIEGIENHISIINEELGVVKNDIQWIKWFVGIMIVAIIGMLIKIFGG